MQKNIKNIIKYLRSTIDSLECEGAIKSGFPWSVDDKDFGMMGLKNIKILKILQAKKLHQKEVDGADQCPRFLL